MEIVRGSIMVMHTTVNRGDTSSNLVPGALTT